MLNAYTPGESIAKKVINEELNGIEIYFAVYPLKGTRETLKKEGFRWNHKKGCWYAKQGIITNSTADVMIETSIKEYEAIAARTGEKVERIQKVEAEDKPAKAKKPAAKKAEPVNKYGVKVGDFFNISWGYEQTNVNWFQVVELVGAVSVRVKEVYPDYESDRAFTAMSEDRIYKLDRSKLAPVRSNGIFIKDSEHGDLKKVQLSKWDGKPYIKIGDYYANRIEGDACKEYVSWYY